MTTDTQEFEPFIKYRFTTTTYPVVVRDRGDLMINGTRIMLADVMDYVKWNQSRAEIYDMLPLTDEQLDGALEYIRDHPEYEEEYQEVLRRAEETRKYWDDKNREHMAYVKSLPKSPERQRLADAIEELRRKMGD